jgi:hypothetical protein
VLLAPACLACLACLGWACGGGGGGGGGGNPTQPNASLTFTPAGVGAPSIRLEREGVGASTLVLEVMADQVTDLYGVAFDLSFPSNLLRFDGGDEGDFLSGPAGSGVGTSLQLTANGGVLVVGVTRLGDVPGRTGSGVLLTLRFTAIASGTGSFSFSANQAFDSDGDALGSVAWGGGSVRTQL